MQCRKALIFEIHMKNKILFTFALFVSTASFAGLLDGVKADLKAEAQAMKEDAKAEAVAIKDDAKAKAVAAKDDAKTKAMDAKTKAMNKAGEMAPAGLK